jgi:hypothetical protein
MFPTGAQREVLVARRLTALTTLLKNAFDFEHWLDPSLQIRAPKELGLENIWPLSAREPDLDHEARSTSFWHARAANTQR